MERRVRGIVIDENALLQIHRNKKDEDYYVFPGGGVEGAETDEEALLREFIEELRVEIEILQKTPFFTHYLPCGDEESFYFCQITSGELGTGDGP